MKTHKIIMDSATRSRLLEQYQGRRVLVTGADGFLGMNMVLALQDLGAELSIITRREKPRSPEFKGHVFRGDLKVAVTVKEAVQDQSIVFDFAGVSGAVQSNQNPVLYLEQECFPHLQLLQFCREQSPSLVVVFPSTRLVYGKPQGLPVDENHPLNPLNIYATHKITVENYLKVFGATHGLRYCIIRLSNPYGPYQPLHTVGYGIINHFVHLASEGKPITLFGEGHQKRDYLFVDDVVITFLRVALDRSCHQEIFNLGGREALSLKNAALKISELAGNSPIRFEAWPEEYQSIETGDYQSNLSKLDQYLSLPPQIPFDQGIAITLEYYRKMAHSNLQV